MLDQRTLAFALPRIWRYRLDRCPIPVSTWRAMFQAANYTHDFHLAARPRWPMRRYRGAVKANREGLSWTTRLDQAVYFARSRQGPRQFGDVWQTTAPPSRVLAFITDEGEYVIDARGLPMEMIDPASRTVRWGARLGPARPWRRWDASCADSSSLASPKPPTRPS